MHPVVVVLLSNRRQLLKTKGSVPRPSCCGQRDTLLGPLRSETAGR